ILKKNDYNLNEHTVDWIKITRNMNGIRDDNLPPAIYLPPKISFEEYLRKHKQQRSLAGTKRICRPISKDYLKSRFGEEGESYLKYFELISSRKVELKKGQSYASVIKNDSYSYGTTPRGVKLLKSANGLKGKYAEKDQIVYLPFC